MYSMLTMNTEHIQMWIVFNRDKNIGISYIWLAYGCYILICVLIAILPFVLNQFEINLAMVQQGVFLNRGSILNVLQIMDIVEFRSMT